MNTLRDAHVFAERAVDLLNVDEPEWATVLARHGETDLTGLADETVAFGAVLTELRTVFATLDRDSAAERLNELLAHHGAAPRLVRHEGWDWHLHVDRVDDTWSNWLGSSAALALALRLTARPGVPWGTCAADDCDRVFLDDGHGGIRRFCAPTCATRDRVRRHRSRRVGPAAGCRGE